MAEYNKVAQLIDLMDQHRNGVASKQEFMAFASAEYDRVAADRSGTLTRQELSNSAFVHPQHRHPGGVGR
ncbi:hypothetical protein [Rhodoblastus sp.]|uniref:hypothetical protein n=1 Tax=Rhodoblastus sp. TaxID=1962975 RepID=UPI003F94DADB